MKRRSLLQGAAASLVTGLVGADALAAPTRSFEERLARLEDHLDRIEARRPAGLLKRGLREAGLSSTLFADILGGLLFAQVFKACTEDEQRDARWGAVIERAVPRFTSSLAALMNWMETRRDNRALRRALRRPNKTARIVERGLFRKHTPERERALRRGLAEMATLDEDSWDQTYADFDATAHAVGTDRAALSLVANKGKKDNTQKENDQKKEEYKQKLLVGLLLLLGSPLVFGLGVLTVALGLEVAVMALGIAIIAVGVAMCIAALVMFIAGIVMIIQGFVLMARASSAQAIEGDGEALDENDLALLGDVERLLAA